MNYNAIQIQGNIISSEILEKIRTVDIRFQKASDFNSHQGASVRYEINPAWSMAVSNWNTFRIKRDALSETDSGTTETRRNWIIPLLSVIGCEINLTTAEIINYKSYTICHRASINACTSTGCYGCIYFITQTEGIVSISKPIEFERFRKLFAIRILKWSNLTTLKSNKSNSPQLIINFYGNNN